MGKLLKRTTVEWFEGSEIEDDLDETNEPEGESEGESEDESEDEE
jgi:hypothetical protein